jgi:TRAP-type C4-dicarboxylate transport system substrate-binding protein
LSVGSGSWTFLSSLAEGTSFGSLPSDRRVKGLHDVREGMKGAGASPTPMAWPEVFTGLQEGAIEGQENPLEIIVSSKLWEVQKFLALTNHVRVAWIVLADERLWKRMTPETQQVMTSAWREVSADMEKQILASEQKSLDEIKSRGMTVVEPDVELFRQGVKDVWREIAPKAWGTGTYERIQATR